MTDSKVFKYTSLSSMASSKCLILVIFILSLFLGSKISYAQIGTDSTFSNLNVNDPEQRRLPYNIILNASDSMNIASLDSLLNLIDSVKLSRKYGAPSGIYGHDMFRTDEMRVYQSDDIVNIPDSYVLGVGDEIVVSIFGAAQFDAKFQIGREGHIQPSGLPKIFLRGVEWGKAKEMIRRRFQQFYIFRPEQSSFSLSRPRNVVINLFGEVKNPGSYNLSATNTAFNALMAAGGPTKKGSVRKIMLTDGSTQKILDLYALMENPLTQFDYYLSDNSVIQIPLAGKLVKIEGAVQRPLIYELTDRESLSALLRFAGGLKGNAVKEFLQIQRYFNDQLQLLDIPLKPILDGTTDIELYNGDLITVREVKNEMHNSISVEGAVQHSGSYALNTTPRVSDLLQKAILAREARTDVAFVIRTRADSTNQIIQIDLDKVIKDPMHAQNILLEAKDRLVISNQNKFNENALITVSGAVRDTLSLPIHPDSTVSIFQAVLLAGGLTPEADDRAFIVRTDPNNHNNKTYIPVNIAKAMADPMDPANLTMGSRDRLIVMSRRQLSEVSTVAISGAVRQEGDFHFDPSLKLQDLILLAGGLKSEASGKIDVYRVRIERGEVTETFQRSIEVDLDLNIIRGPQDFKLMPYDKFVARSVAEYSLQKMVRITGEVREAGPYAITKQNERVTDLIMKAGGITAEAFPEGAYLIRDSEYKLITNLLEILFDPSSDLNLLLKPGDQLIIPRKQNEVIIFLENTLAASFLQPTDTIMHIGVAYTPGKSAKWYIDQYVGGFSTEANPDHLVVVYANGAAIRTRKFLFFRKYPKVGPGSKIYVFPNAYKTDEEITNERVDYPKLKKGVVVNINGTPVEGTSIRDASNNNNQ